MADEVSDQFDPRARIHRADGTKEPVRRQDIHGLDEWGESWAQNPLLPSPMSFSAWQMTDEDHPATGGDAGYRIVYKTIRTIFAPPHHLDTGNLLIRWVNDQITWGETRYPNALAHRRESEWLVPQWGRVSWQGVQGSYDTDPDREVAFSAHQETTPYGNFVELLYRLPEADTLDWAEKLALGRSRIAPLTAAMDLLWGERVLGPVITEEVGAIFDDWHWNRLLGGPTVAWEGQAQIAAASTSELQDALDVALIINREHTEDERERLRIAAQWYWRADREQDHVMKFLTYWLCIEAVALENGAHKIGPVKTMVAAILDTKETAIDGIGRIYNVRGEIAHGHSRAVSSEALAGVRAIAEAVLSRGLLGRVSSERVDALRDCAIRS
jgi:hypothetical protein